MPTLQIRTPEGITLRRDVAGAASRFGAALIDGIVIWLLAVLVFVSVLLLLATDPSGPGGFVVGITFGGILLFIPTYFWLFGTFMEGRTPGKLAFGLRVVTVDGYPASTWQLLLRSVLMPIDMLPGFPAMIGFLLEAVTPKRQRLGDMVARTLVVREPKNVLDVEPFAGQTYANLPGTPHEFSPSVSAKLDKEDFEFLRSLLSRQGLDLEVKRKLYVKSGHHFAHRLGITDFEDSRLFLRDLYVYLREARQARA